MDTVDGKIIDAAEKMRIIHLEAQVVGLLAEMMQIDTLEALDIWYRSSLSTSVERNEHGLQYLDAAYIAEELMTRIAEKADCVKAADTARD